MECEDVEELIRRFDEAFSSNGAINHHGLVVQYTMLDQYQREAVKQFLRKTLE